MNYPLEYPCFFLFALCFFLSACDSTETLTNHEITLELRQYFGPNWPDVNGIYLDSVYHESYARTSVITKEVLDVEKAVDLSDFPQVSYMLSGSHGSLEMSFSDMPEVLNDFVFLFFDIEGIDYFYPDLIGIGSDESFPKKMAAVNEDSVEVRVYALVLERPEQDFPESIEINWRHNGMPQSLVVKPSEHYVPLENIVRVKDLPVENENERSDLLVMFGSDQDDPELSPILLVRKLGLWDSGEITWRNFFHNAVGSYHYPERGQGVEYGVDLASQAQVLPESEFTYFLLKRPLIGAVD